MAKRNKVAEVTDLQPPDDSEIPDSSPSSSPGGINEADLIGFDRISGDVTVVGFLGKKNIGEANGAKWRGKIVGGFLVPDKQKGGYRAVTAVQLTGLDSLREGRALFDKKGEEVFDLSVGDVVAVGEKKKLSFRGCHLGQEVYFRCIGSKDVGQPSEMLEYDKRGDRTKPAPGTKTVAELLKADFVSRGGAGDEWTGEQIAKAMKAANGATEMEPF